MSNTPDQNDAPDLRHLPRQIMVPDHERLNPGLRTLLLDMAERIPDQGTNRPSGESYFVNKWLSARTLNQLPEPGIATLAAQIENLANSERWPALAETDRLHIHSMWTIISRKGMEGKPHRHGGRVSGAYYVDAGASNGTENGAFAIYTPSGKLAGTIAPKSGLMLLFPSEMRHGVLRYESDQPRIVISFNLTLKPKGGPQPG